MALAAGGLNGLPQQHGLSLEVEVLKQLANRGGTHAALEVLAKPIRRCKAITHLAKQLVIVDDVAGLDRLELAPGLLDALHRLLGVPLVVAHKRVGLLAELRLDCLALGVADLAGYGRGVRVLGVARVCDVLEPEVVLNIKAGDLAFAEPVDAALQALTQLGSADVAVRHVLQHSLGHLTLEGHEVGVALLDVH